MDQFADLETALQSAYGEIFEAVPFGVVFHSASGAILAANRMAQEILGLSRDQILGRTALDPRWRAIREDGAEFPGQEHPAMQALRSGQVQRDLVMGICNPLDGAYRWINITATPFFGRPGEPASLVMVTFEDITHRKQNEAALRQSEERFSKAFYQGPTARLIARLSDGLIVDANDSFMELIECSRQQALGHTSQELGLFLPDERPARIIHRLIETGRLTNLETRLHTSRGKAIDVLFSSQVIELDGEPHHISTLIDITERKRAEQTQQERSLELSRLNIELARARQIQNEFLAMISHELRTPLNTITMASEALQAGLYGGVTPLQAERMKIIQASSSHLLEIITDILDFTKLETGQFELQPEAVDVDSLCYAAIQIIKQQAARKRLQVSTSVELAVETIVVDPQRLRQILVNLLGNAIKFTPEGGRIGLEVRQEPGGGALRFTIWDTGIGVPLGQIEQIFRPFTQLDSTLSREYEGLGLGLAFAHRLVDLMGGSLGIESEPGQGSRFWLILPVRPPVKITAVLNSLRDAEAALAGGLPADALAAPAAMAVAARQRVILVVEDNNGNLEMLSDMLKINGYMVIQAMDGAEALEQAQQVLPDAILMDIQLPVMDGLEAIRRLRAMPQFAQTRIIALTALTMPGDRQRCLDAGANVYLSKPINFASLLAMLESD